MIQRLFRTLRYRFFLHAGALPYILGASIAYHTVRTFNLYLFLLGLLGLALAFVGVESFNEYFEPSKEVFSQSYEPSKPSRSVFWIGAIAFTAAFSIGVQLALISGAFVVLLAVIGFVFAAFYVGPPLQLAYRGIGELSIFLAYGPLITLGSYYLQAANVDIAPIFASVVPALLIMALTIGNEVIDYYEDMLVGKRNVVARVGRKKGVKIYAIVLLSSYVYIAIGLFSGLPTLSLVSLLTIPIAVRNVQSAFRHYDSPTIFASVMLHTIVLYLTITTILALSYLLS